MLLIALLLEVSASVVLAFRSFKTEETGMRDADSSISVILGVSFRFSIFEEERRRY